jgi:hypothetical protein
MHVNVTKKNEIAAPNAISIPTYTQQAENAYRQPTCQTTTIVFDIDGTLIAKDHPQWRLRLLGVVLGANECLPTAVGLFNLFGMEPK